MKQGVWWFFSVLGVLIASSMPTTASSSLTFTAVAVDSDARAGVRGRIYAGSTSILTIGGRGERSLTDAMEVARRLNVLAEDGLRADEITVRKERRAHAIIARGTPIVIVDQGLAKGHNTSSAHLAKAWAKNLQGQFGRPYLSIRALVVPVGETRTAPLHGNIVGRPRLIVESPMITASYNAGQGAIDVLGIAPGRSELGIFDDRSSLKVPVWTAKYAGHISASLHAVVTGNPASVDVIGEAVRAVAAAHLYLEPGAWGTIVPWLQEITPLSSGISSTVPVRVTASGEDYLPYRARPTVQVRNDRLVTNNPVEVLFVSNSPERLLSHGLWFEGSLRNHGTARLLYHHVNGSGVRSELVFELWNLGEREEHIHIMAGTGGPSPDESWAGHRAMQQFMRRRVREVGWMAPVKPGTAVPILSQSITPGATASGVLELRLSSENNLRIRCWLARPRLAWLPYTIRSYLPSPTLGRWQYPNPRQELRARYIVGREWAFITVGDQKAIGTKEEDTLRGAYGVIHDIELELINPTVEPADVAIMMEPGGGAARGALIVDRKVVEAALITRDQEATLARYHLMPGAVQRVRIEIMPQGGSNYPVRLFARPI